MKYQATQIVDDHWMVTDESSGEVDLTKEQAEAIASLLMIMDRGGGQLDTLIEKLNACDQAITGLARFLYKATIHDTQQARSDLPA